MAVQRSITCKSLERGLNMVENQFKTASDSTLDQEIADSRLEHMLLSIL